MSELGIDISSANVHYVGCRGNRLSIIHKSSIEVGTVLLPRFRTYLLFSGHALTHQDLPWPLQETLPQLFPEIEKFDDLATEKYLQPRTMKAVVLDISDKKSEVDKLIADEFINPDMSRPNFEGLMDVLEVKIDDLGELANRKDLLDGRTLIFKTGWENFAEREIDLNNRFFELRHPFLIHPYLHLETLREILDCGIEGIGTDAYCLENPVYFTDEQNVPDYASRYFGRYKKQDYLPVLSTLLSRFRHYIKNLRSLNKIKTEIHKHVSGTLSIIPIDFGDRDMCLVKVFFKQ